MSFQIVGLGELLFDMLPEGKRPGGAPANAAVIAAGLGLETALITAVGKDENGTELINKLQEFGVDTSLVSRNDHPTGKVEVTLVDAIPSYDICLGSAWDHIPLTAEAEKAVTDCDAVVFGSLAQRSAESRQTIMHLVKTSNAKWKIFDVNLRQNFYSKELLDNSLKAANVLKISDEELPAAAAALGLSENPEQCISQLAEKYSLSELIFTKGACGSIIFNGTETVSTPAYTMGQLVDTVGAGDAFLAGYISGRLKKLSVREAAELASKTAGKVCSVAGAWHKLA